MCDNDDEIRILRPTLSCFPSTSLGRTLNCLNGGGVCKTLRTLPKGIRGAHATADFYGR
jgi:hypothetical protein